MLAVLLTCFWSDSTGCNRSLYYYLICMYDCNEDSALFTSVKKQSKHDSVNIPYVASYCFYFNHVYMWPS